MAVGAEPFRAAITSGERGGEGTRPTGPKPINHRSFVHFIRGIRGFISGF